ncbi:retrovirus-related pol polyprotein from transposon TNT 1-94 [Tanacetum coccineum]
MPPKKTTSHSVETQKPELKIHNRKPKNVKNIGSSKKAKTVKSNNANHLEPNHNWGSNATDIASSSSIIMIGTVRFGNKNIARIMEYGDYQLGNVTISRVYYVEGLGHNLFSVGQFCDADLEVAFWKILAYSFLRSKEEAPNAIVKCIKNIQVRLNAIVRNVRTDNGTEFVNQTLREFYENVGIWHQTSVSRTLQQNGVVERRNQTLVEAARTNSGPGLHSMTPATSSSGLIPNFIPQQPCIPPPRDDWDRLFQPMFDEYFTPPSIDALSTSTPSTQEQEHSPIISQGLSLNVRQIHTPFEHLGRWTKDHPITNVIDNPSQSVSTRKQLQTDAMWCYFDAFLTSVELKNFKQAMTEPSWIDAMQEEIHEFQSLEVWELALCLDKVLLIKLKWIYKVKTDKFGVVLKNKARLVAQGFRQEEE